MLAEGKQALLNAAMRFEEDNVWLTPPEATHIQTVTQMDEADGIWSIVRLGCIDWVDSIVAPDEPSNVSYENRYVDRWRQARHTWQPRHGEVICAPLSPELLRDLARIMLEFAAHNRYIANHLEEYIANQEEQGAVGLTDMDDKEREAMKTDLLDAAIEDADMEDAMAGAIEHHLETKS